MKWIAISGSRITNKKIEDDVRKIVREIIIRGDGIVSGGAIGVDYFAADEALKLDQTANQIKIIIPASLETYSLHYRERGREGVVTPGQAENLITQLKKIKETNQHALIETPKNNTVDKDAYFERDSKVIEAADELIAFHANKSEGTQDTITKAEIKRIPVKRFNYVIE